MVWVLVGVGVATLVVAVSLVVLLVRRLQALSASVVGLQRDLVPVLEEIRQRSEEAQGRMARLEERRAALEPGPMGG